MTGGNVERWAHVTRAALADVGVAAEISDGIYAEGDVDPRVVWRASCLGLRAIGSAPPTWEEWCSAERDCGGAASGAYLDRWGCP